MERAAGLCSEPRGDRHVAQEGKGLMREIEQRLRAYGAACAAEGGASAAAERALPVRMLAAVRVDGALDRFIGVREEGGVCTVVALRWLAREERRFWGVPSVAAAVAGLWEAGVLAGTQVEWLDPEAERA
jgi:hypothetical protein